MILILLLASYIGYFQCGLCYHQGGHFYRAENRAEELARRTWLIHFRFFSPHNGISNQDLMYTLVNVYITMENHRFVMGKSTINGDCP
jgi:transposase-like protein